MNLTALNHHLKPLDKYLNDNTISEIMINNEKEIFIEKSGIIENIKAPDLTNNHLNILTKLIANYNGKDLNKDNPSISGVLPNKERVQIVTKPISANNDYILSIRKQTLKNVSLDDYQYNIDCQQFIKDAIKDKLNILISGGTNTGKTTFLNACLLEIPSNERIITLEDTREISTIHKNQVNLIAAKETMTDLLETSLRLRPDRIIMGEIRGIEAASFIEAIATGHDGTLSTIHASSPEFAITQLAIKAQRGNMQNLSQQELIKYIKSLIPVVIQLSRHYDEKTKSIIRYVSEVKYFR